MRPYQQVLGITRREKLPVNMKKPLKGYLKADLGCIGEVMSLG